MNSKLINKKPVKRTPLRTSFVQNNQIPASTSRVGSSGSSLYAAICSKPVSAEEHNKVMIQNQRLAKENAYLKSQLNLYKETLRKTTNDMVDLKQHLSAANTQNEKLKSDLKRRKEPQNPLVSDQFKTAVNLLMEDYLAIDCIRNQINEFGGRVETIKGIMSSLQSLVECDNESNESQSLELSSDRLDPIRSSNSSMRLSLSSQEINVKRRLSSERIRRDFQILTELSTILEMSTEQRVSSFGSIASNNTTETVNANQSETTVGSANNAIAMTSTSTNAMNGSASTTINKKATKVIATAKSVKTRAKNESQPKKETKLKNKTKTETKPKKKIDGQTKSKLKVKANDSIDSIYDFNEDEENKENAIPLSLNPPQRHSKRIRSKRYSLNSQNSQLL